MNTNFTPALRWYLARNGRTDLFGETFPIPAFAVLATDPDMAALSASMIVGDTCVPGSLEFVALETTVLGLAGVPVIAVPDDDDEPEQCDPNGIPRPELPPVYDLDAVLRSVIRTSRTVDL